MDRSQVPVLAFFVAAASEARDAAMGVYVQQQLEYGKLWRLFEFSQARLALWLHLAQTVLRAPCPSPVFACASRILSCMCCEEPCRFAAASRKGGQATVCGSRIDCLAAMC